MIIAERRPAESGTATIDRDVDDVNDHNDHSDHSDEDSDEEERER